MVMNTQDEPQSLMARIAGPQAEDLVTEYQKALVDIVACSEPWHIDGAEKQFRNLAEMLVGRFADRMEKQGRSDGEYIDITQADVAGIFREEALLFLLTSILHFGCRDPYIAQLVDAANIAIESMDQELRKRGYDTDPR